MEDLLLNHLANQVHSQAVIPHVNQVGSQQEFQAVNPLANLLVSLYLVPLDNQLGYLRSNQVVNQFVCRLDNRQHNQL